jgi:hypothetical protein
MTDNIKTWPENISLFCIDHNPDLCEIYVNEPKSFFEAKEIGHIDWETSEEVNQSITQAKYIRADIVKEREEKLIQSVKDWAENNIGAVTYDLEGLDSMKISDIYKLAGLEELK